MAQGTCEMEAARTGLNRSRRVATLALLLSALLVTAVFGIRTVGENERGSAVVPLPPLAAVTSATSPRFLFSVNGVSRPLGVAVSPAGDRIYVTESDGERETRVFDRDGRFLGTLNPPDSTAASRVPLYVAVSPQGRVYVSDRRAGTVHIYSEAGGYEGQVAPPSGLEGSWAPMALGFDGQGRLLTTNVAPGNHGVVVFDPDGSPIQRFGKEGSGPEEFSYPNGIAADSSGRLLVADSNNGRVAIVDPAGEQPWSVLGRTDGRSNLGLPRGMVLDERGRLYLADTINHNVLAFELSGNSAKLLFTLGSQGIKDGQFGFPNGLALDQSGRLYVADRENNRVQVWTY